VLRHTTESALHVFEICPLSVSGNWQCAPLFTCPAVGAVPLSVFAGALLVLEFPGHLALYDGPDRLAGVLVLAELQDVTARVMGVAAACGARFRALLDNGDTLCLALPLPPRNPTLTLCFEALAAGARLPPAHTCTVARQLVVWARRAALPYTEAVRDTEWLVFAAACRRLVAAPALSSQVLSLDGVAADAGDDDWRAFMAAHLPLVDSTVDPMILLGVAATPTTESHHFSAVETGLGNGDDIEDDDEALCLRPHAGCLLRLLHAAFENARANILTQPAALPLAELLVELACALGWTDHVAYYYTVLPALGSRL
jgi:hypothetical protein